MKLYLVRHGITDWNSEKRIQGQVDIPLNETGRQLAKKTAEGLKDIPFDLCYSSPLIRARETAELIVGERKIQIIKEPRIIEMDFGKYEGKCCSKEGWELPEEFHNFFDHPEQYRAPEGGENFVDVKRRTGEFLADICSHSLPEDSHVLIVTHGAALAGILCNIKGTLLADYWGTGVHKNCAVTEVLVQGGRLEILSENVVYYDGIADPWADQSK